MSAKLQHVAIVSSDPPRLAEFYRELFGMTGNPAATERGAASSVDGYVWLAVNTRPRGRQGGLDHFGIEVPDVATVDAIRDRARDDYPTIEIARRTNRGFAAFSMHDPLGNVFDLSPAEMHDAAAVYAGLTEQTRNPRHISHIMLRSVDPKALSRFYQDMFALREKEKESDDPNTYLTDGTMTLVLAPWRITDYNGSGIERPALDHIGFEVESLEAFEADLRDLAARRPELAPLPVKEGGEGNVRMKLLAKCPLGTYHFADPDGVLLDVSERRS
jgi:catechol 2,3-dioxygenase-like lactoylglutathione lyase family enzyme